MARNDLIILDGCTFFYSDENGDVEAQGPEGLFYQDVRHLSRWGARIDGHELDPLTSRRVDYFSARVVCKTSDEADDAPPISVRRDRFVTEGAHEDIVLENLSAEPHSVRLELSFGSDFADVMEAQSGGNGEGRSWQEASAHSVTLWNDRDGYRRGTVLTFNRSGRVTRDSATFEVALAPHKSWSLCVDMTPIVDGKRRPPLLRCNSFHEHAHKMPMSLHDWLADSPDLETDRPALGRTYRQSLLDIAALRVRPDEIAIRWARALRSRGSKGPPTSTATATSSTASDRTPTRHSTTTAGRTPTTRSGLPTAARRSRRSRRASFRATHTMRALRLRTARLLREVWRDEETAARLEEEAADLKRRFNRDFWVKSRRHYALALDGEKSQVDAMTSNTGHLLWSGILEGARAAAVVRRLVEPGMFTGWGIRSMSSEDAGYNPLEYHNGTVWPHDTAICAEGMRRYGFYDEAGTVCRAVLDAAERFSNQLPEVFAGFPRDDSEVPVEYPNALKPQSWAAAAPLLALRTLLGLDVVDGRLRSDPHVPEELGKLRLRHVGYRGRYEDP